LRAEAPLTIAVVNRFAPPDGAPTAAAAAALARELAAALPHARIILFASRAAYRPGGAPSVGVIPAGVTVERVASLYDGRWLPLRLAASLLEGWALARRAARAAEVVISLTDPPLLSLWVGPACRRRGRRWIEWTLDRYPDFFAAAGLGRAECWLLGPLLRWLARRDARLRPEAVIGLGPGQLAHLAAARGDRPPTLVLPVGLEPPPPCPASGDADSNAPLTLAYAGTLGAAHDPAALVALVERADPARFRFLFAVTGRHAAALRRRLAGHPAVVWREHLERAELVAAAAHVVTLSGPATHLCVPSKAVTAMALGRPLLFAGRAAADTWQQLGAAGWLIPVQPGGGYRPADIDAALAALADPAARAGRAAAARDVAATLIRQRQASIERLAALIAGAAATPPS
jgi:hypothetical protein